jgi:hypothetical protein
MDRKGNSKTSVRGFVAKRITHQRKRTMMRHFVGEGFTELNGGQLEWTQIF